MSFRQFTDSQKNILKCLDIQTVYLFGSHAQNKAGPLSDYDYAVLTAKQRHHRGDPLYFQLYDILSENSPRSLQNDVIDIIFLRDAPLELAFHVIRYGVILFDQNIQKRLNFETKKVLEYCDYQPLLKQFNEAILKSI